MRTTALVFAVLMLCSLPNVALAQAPVFINFDDLSAPCDLASAQPLRDEYAALGLKFWGSDDGGAAVLDECSGLGVPGYSSPNFAVIDSEALLANGGVPYALRFGFTGDAPRRVRVRVAGTPGTTVVLSCRICPWAVPECNRWHVVVLDDAMQTLEVWAEYPFGYGCTVHPSHSPDGTWIVDDLELGFQMPGAPIPLLSTAGAAIFLVVIAALGFVLIRRVTGSG